MNKSLKAASICIALAVPVVAGPSVQAAVSAFATRTSGPAVTGASDSGHVPMGLDRIDQRSNTIDRSYTYSNDGTGVNVYVVDTGVYAAHNEFGSRVKDGWSYLADSANFSGGSPVVGQLPSCKVNSGSYEYVASEHPVDVDTFDRRSAGSADTSDKGKTDNEGHGTHVAGTVGGSTVGVAPGVDIYPVRVLNSCGVGLASMATAGLQWILSHHTNEKAIVNMSVGFDEGEGSVDFDNAVKALINEGVVVVAAAGNDSKSACSTSPANIDGVISVGSVGVSAFGSTAPAVTEAWYTNFGSCVDIFAPGGSGEGSTYPAGTTSAWIGNSSGVNPASYAVESGTSMAAPHVSGVLAQWMQGLSGTPSASWQTDAMAFLKRTATCGAVTYDKMSAANRTPNRLLYTGANQSAPCAPTDVKATQAAGASTISWVEVPAGNGSDVTGYQVTTVPSSAGCSTTSATVLSCAISGLTDGVQYTVSVKAVNATGAGDAGTVKVVAGTSGVATPAVSPASATVKTSGTSMTIAWPATAPEGFATYTVTLQPAAKTCTTQTTSCTFDGLTIGKAYAFTISASNTAGTAAAKSLSVTVTAGFSVLASSVKVKSKTSLTKIVGTVSKGARSYKVTSGKCRIAAGKLVAPATAGTCRFKVSVAKKGSFTAMANTFTVTVSK